MSTDTSIISVSLANLSSNTAAGGLNRFINIAKRFESKDSIEHTILTNTLGKKGMKDKLAGEFEVIESPFKTDPVTSTAKVALMYTYLSIKSLFLSPPTNSPDIVYSISSYLPNILAARRIKSKEGGKYIQIIHHMFPPPSERKGPLITNILAYSAQKLSLILIQSKADHIIAVSPQSKKELIREGFDESQISVNPNGVLPSKFEKYPADERYDCVFIGRMDDKKGVSDFPKIIGRIRDKRPQTNFCLIGSITDKKSEKLMSELEREGVTDGVRVSGYLPDEEAYSILKGSKVFMFPSHEEGFGIAILEAICCSTVPVVWDLEVYQELFGDAVVKVPENRLKEYSNEVVNLLNNTEKLDQYVSSGRTIIEKYKWPNISTKELEILKYVK